MKKYLLSLIALWLLSVPAIALDGSCNYTAGGVVATGFTNCGAEIVEAQTRGVIATTATNSGNDITATSVNTPAITTLRDGITIVVDSPVTLSGAGRINLDGTGLKNVVSSSLGATGAGDMVSGSRYVFTYKTSITSWVADTALSSGSFASAAASYLVVALSAGNTADRQLTEGTGIDFTDAGANGNFTVTTDLTEFTSTLSIGAGAFTALTFDAGAVDTVFNFATNSFIISQGGTAPVVGVDDQGEFRLFEEDAGGSNYIGFAAPAAIATDRHCVLVDGAAPIPDSCVGDGVDAGSAGGDNATVNGAAVTDFDLDDATPAAVSGANVKWQKDASSPPNVSAYTPIASTSVIGTIQDATTTEQLTGTDAAKAATPDSVASIWEQGADVASAGTTSLGEGGYFNITGTTTITDIDFATDKAGRRAWVKFAGILTLTYNASTLILPTSATITTAAGDTAELISEGADVIRVVSYNRATGAALSGSGSGGGRTLVSTCTTTSGSSCAITSGLSTCTDLQIEFDGVSQGAAATGVSLAVSGNGGVNYGTAKFLTDQSIFAGSSTYTGSALVTGMDGTVQNAPAFFTNILDSGDSAQAVPLGGFVPKNATGATSRVDAIKFTASGQNFDAGEIRVYCRP